MNFKIYRFKTIGVLFLVSFFVLLSSCYYDNGEDLYPIDPNECVTQDISYSNTIQNIMVQNCAVSGCHVKGGQPPLLVMYQDVKDNIDRIQFRALEEKSMPPTGPLSSCEQQQLSAWIASGLPE